MIDQLLTSEDRVRFWPAESVGVLDFAIPVLRNPSRDQRDRWPGGTPPDWRAISQELAASRSAYFVLRRVGGDRQIIEILSGRLIVRIDITLNSHGQARLWLSGHGVRFASNADRRPFLVQGRPTRHRGVILLHGDQFRSDFEREARFGSGRYVNEIRSLLSVARDEGDASLTRDGCEEAPDQVTAASEVALLRSLELFIDSEYELEQQKVRTQPAFTYLKALPEPRRASMKQFFRFRLVDATEHRRMVTNGATIKMLAVEPTPGERIIFEVDDLEPPTGTNEILLVTGDQEAGAALPASGTLVPIALDTLLKVRKGVIDDLRFGRTNNRWLVPVAAGTRVLSPVKTRPYSPPSGSFMPNASQKQAIQKGLSTDDYMLVLGPPGTGKTTVINSWVDDLVSGQGKRILITSQNNQAVDNVLVRVASDPRFTCVRIGNEARVGSEVRELLIDNCAAALQRTLVSSVEERSLLTERVRAALAAAVQALGSEREDGAGEDSSPREGAGELTAESPGPGPAVREELAARLATCAALFGGEAALLSTVLAVDVGQWMVAAEELVELAASRDEELASRDARRAQGGWRWLFHRWKASRHQRLADAHTRALDARRERLRPILEQSLTRLDAILGVVRGWHTALSSARQQALYPLLLRLVDVVGATCMGINTNRLFKDVQFDVVIVDESGQIQLHNLIVPTSKGERVILVGDHKQLPPMAEPELVAEVRRRAEVEQTPIATELLQKSWFEVMWERTPADRRAMLNTQFRCPSVISDFISHAFYEDAYFAGESMKAKQPLLSDFSSTMVFIDTSRLPAARRAERTRRTPEREEVLGNPCESDIVLLLLELFATRLPELADRGEIGIIVPYKNHVTEVVQLVNRARREGRLDRLRTPPVELVSSVDGYQGQERDLIIHAFTRSNRSAAVGFLHDWRRLNVAMTRAKRQLVMVGDFGTLAAQARPGATDAAFKQAMYLLRRHLQTRGQLISAVDWLATRQVSSP